jgi:hypothetical protein
MPWTVQPVGKLGIIEVRLSGDFTSEEMKLSTVQALGLGREAGIVRYLVDAADLGATPPVADILQLPATGYASLGLDRQSRIAITLPRNQEARAAAQFYETACLNRGWNVKLHATRDAAVAWLLAST